MGIILGNLGKLCSFGTILSHLFLIFVWFWKIAESWFLRNLFFDNIYSRIDKNELTYKLCTILEWDKCQQFAVFYKFLIFWFVLTQSCKTFVSFFFGPDSTWIFCNLTIAHWTKEIVLKSDNILHEF